MTALQLIEFFMPLIIQNCFVIKIFYIAQLGYPIFQCLVITGEISWEVIFIVIIMMMLCIWFQSLVKFFIGSLPAIKGIKIYMQHIFFTL